MRKIIVLLAFVVGVAHFASDAHAFPVNSWTFICMNTGPVPGYHGSFQRNADNTWTEEICGNAWNYSVVEETNDWILLYDSASNNRIEILPDAFYWDTNGQWLIQGRHQKF